MNEPGMTRDDAIKRALDFLEGIPQQSFGPGAVRHDVTWTADFLEEGTVGGADAVAEALKPFLAAFPDLKVSLREDDIPAVFENGTLAFEVTVQGTNTGELPGIGATGRYAEGQGATFVTFDAEGKIAAVRTYWDWGALMAQLGMRSFARPGPVPA